jgi:hypothetical protein
MNFSDLRSFVFEMWESNRHVNWRRRVRMALDLEAESSKRKCMGHCVKNQFIEVINKRDSVGIT